MAVYNAGPFLFNRTLGYQQGDVLVTEKVAKEIVSLPMYAQLTGDQQARVVDGVSQFISAPAVC